MTTTTVFARPTVPRLVWALVLIGLLTVLAVGALIAGGGPPPPPPFNGMIAIGRMNAAETDGFLYVINPDGTRERRVRPEAVEGAFWSPNGKQIGFIDGHVNADGTEFETFATMDGPLFLACWDWSPDGARCLAEGWNDVEPSQNGLYLLSASDRTNPFQLTHHRDVPGVFSRDGGLVAFNREDHLWVIRSDGTGEHQVGSLVISHELSFAPDDRSILVTSEEVLYRVDVATGVPTPIRIEADPSAEIWGGIFSPDGTRILFRRPQGENADLFTMRVDGTEVFQLTTTALDEWFMDWGTRPLDK